jgi:simple sugar transport system permease protein
MIGEYFRDAFSYGVIALALVLHAWRKRANAELSRQDLRGGMKARKARKERRKKPRYALFWPPYT